MRGGAARGAATEGERGREEGEGNEPSSVVINGLNWISVERLIGDCQPSEDGVEQNCEQNCLGVEKEKERRRGGGGEKEGDRLGGCALCAPEERSGRDVQRGGHCRTVLRIVLVSTKRFVLAFVGEEITNVGHTSAAVTTANISILRNGLENE